MRDSKDFSLTIHRVRKVPAEVIGESPHAHSKSSYVHINYLDLVTDSFLVATQKLPRPRLAISAADETLAPSFKSSLG